MKSVWDLLRAALKLRSSARLTVFEMGSHDGSDTVRIHRIASEFSIPSRMFAFEPDPRMYPIAASTIGRAAVTLVNAAIGAEDREMTLHLSDSVDGHWRGSSSLRIPKEHLRCFPHISFASKMVVKVRSLDSFCEEHGVEEIDFIWADIQGAERDMFAGGKKMLDKTRFLFLERSNDELYDGQWTTTTMMEEISSDWGVVEMMPTDVFLWNKKIFGDKDPLK